MPAFADHLPLTHDNATDARIRTGAIQPQLSQP